MHNHRYHREGANGRTRLGNCFNDGLEPFKSILQNEEPVGLATSEATGIILR